MNSDRIYFFKKKINYWQLSSILCSNNCEFVASATHQLSLLKEDTARI
ncbi:hypothetical protein FDUTEX481_04040 [Tolypothrix sp. PCC 7601]|nr:hypothetical protein FDUTEX481_04040 [Tolypothrix sp. PCC 7601]